MGCGAYIDAEHGQQSGYPLLQSRQDGRGGGDVCPGVEGFKKIYDADHPRVLLVNIYSEPANDYKKWVCFNLG